MIYRGRTFGSNEIGFIRELIAAHPQASRYALSRQLCTAWNWKQTNGELRDMVCRGLLLKLARAGAIELPAGRRAAMPRKAPEPVVPDNTPVLSRLSDIGEIGIEPVRRTPQEGLFNSLMQQYHYLGYQQPVGEHLKYLVTARGQAIACAAWSSAPRHLGCRDRFIGWNPEQRRRNIHLLAYNTRFLILPWVRVEHLASHLLGRLAARIAGDWERAYAHPVHLLETFVDPERFRGTCYRAANWQLLGRTTGRGKDDLTHRANRPEKEVLVYPLHRRFRELLTQ
jgi:uncharacterized protein DUF4338